MVRRGSSEGGRKLSDDPPPGDTEGLFRHAGLFTGIPENVRGINAVRLHLASIYVTILFAFTAAMPAGVSELVDEADSKSVGSNAVWVRFPPPAHEQPRISL